MGDLALRTSPVPLSVDADDAYDAARYGDSSAGMRSWLLRSEGCDLGDSRAGAARVTRRRDGGCVRRDPLTDQSCGVAPDSSSAADALETRRAFRALDWLNSMPCMGWCLALCAEAMVARGDVLPVVLVAVSRSETRCVLRHGLVHDREQLRAFERDFARWSHLIRSVRSSGRAVVFLHVTMGDFEFAAAVRSDASAVRSEA